MRSASPVRLPIWHLVKKVLSPALYYRIKTYLPELAA